MTSRSPAMEIRSVLRLVEDDTAALRVFKTRGETTMTLPSQSSDRRCSKCGTLLDGSRTGEVCVSCALENALRDGLEVAQVSVPAGSGGIPAANPDSGQGCPENSPTRMSALQRFGDYELLEEIARGGMGVVFKARQASLDRLVAIKMLLFGPLASAEVVQRFRTEAAAAASLQHPNIVAVHEVGFREGQHFIAMDYIAGQSLATIVRDRPLPPRQAAAYVKTIAEAIHYAHERGVLHRDLKPSNVLIDVNGEPKVMDFGLAKRLEKDSELTLSGQVLGSPGYMAPEQAAGRRGQVGKRSDVYSLGAILYHLLTGRPPFVAPTVAETLQQVQNAEPVSPTVLNPHLPRDLKTICLKCLEKEAARRYQTARELADDLGRWLRKEPILARPISRPEKLWRWCWRKPVVAALAATTGLLLLAVAIGSPIAAYRIQRERNVAQGRLYAAEMKLAHAVYKSGKTGVATKMLLAQQPPPGQPDLRGFDWRYLYRLCNSSPSEVLATNVYGFSTVAWWPGRRSVVLGTVDGALEIYEGEPQRRSKTWRAHEGIINALAFCPRDPNWLVTISGDDGLLKVWDLVHQRAVVTTNGPKGFLPFVTFSPSGKLLATSAPDNLSMDLWEFEGATLDRTARLTLRTNLPYIGPAAFSPDEQTLAVCADASAVVNQVTLCDQNGRRLATLPTEHTDLIQAIVFSPDGRWLATGGGDERVVVSDLRERKVLFSATDDLVNVMSLAFAADGKALYVGGWDSNLRVWDFANPNKMFPLRGHGAGVGAVAVSPDGSLLASAGRDGTARLWNLRSEDAASYALPSEFKTLLDFEETKGPDPGLVGVVGIAVSPDQTKAVAVANTKLFLCDLATGVSRAIALADAVFGQTNSAFGWMGAAAFSPDGRTLAVGSGLGDLSLLEVATLRPIQDAWRLHKFQLSHTAFGLGGRVLVTGGSFGTGVAFLEIPGGRKLGEIDAMGAQPIQPLAVSADGRLLATGSPRQRILVRDLATHRVIASSPVKIRVLLNLAFSPDGQWLAIPDEWGTIFLWDYRGHRPLRKLAGHAGAVLTLAFSPDGRTLASGSMDHTIKLWHPDIDQEVATLEGHTGWVWCVAFAEQGNALLSGSRDGTLKLWQAWPHHRAE